MAEIRLARLTDAVAIAALTDELGYQVTAEAIVQRLRTVLDRPDTAVLVTCNDADEPVGWVHVGEREFLESGLSVEILGLVVALAYRRQGRAAALVETAERWAAARGHRRLTVRSNVVRAESHPFYERAGYTRAKTQHVYRKSLGGQP